MSRTRRCNNETSQLHIFKKKHTQTHTQLSVNFSTQNNSKSVKINEQQFNKIYIPYIIEKQDESISLRQKATMKHCKF
ncbi:hypothetical protein MGQ_04129, partial [Candida albicans P76067]